MSRFFDALPKFGKVIRQSSRSQVFLGPVTEAPGLPGLTVEQAHLTPESHIDVFTDPHGAAADRFRLLRIHLGQAAARAKLKTLMVTSPLPHDGKSTIALNLATA